MLADYPVCEHPAEKGSQVDEGGIEPIDLRGKRLRRKRPEDRLQPACDEAKPEHTLPGFRMQEQMVDHVETRSERMP